MIEFFQGVIRWFITILCFINHDFITITHDFYNKNVDVYYNKQKIFSSPLKKCKTKETFDFTYQEKNYRLFVNTHHFFFFKKVKFQLYEEDVLLQKSKYKISSFAQI